MKPKSFPLYHRTCWVALILLWLLGAASGLQAATYAYRSDTFAYDTPSASAATVAWHASGVSPACTSYPSGDDDWADIAFPGGFTFTYGAVTYNSVRVLSNGMLAFPPDTSGFHRDYSPQALPITAAGPTYSGCVNAVPKNLMIAYWVDIIAGGIANASVKSEMLTNAGSGQRRFVVTWDNVALYGNTATRYSFQIVLFESAAGVNGNFKFQYTTGASTGSGATVGVQLTTTDYTQYAYNQNFIDTALGTAILWYPANQLAAKSAEYRFDEGSWSGAAGEILDTSGNLRHASRVSANVANVAAGKLCRGATFTNNTSNATVDAVATPLAPGNQGAVDFWYKSNVAWNAASSDAMLLDATTTASKPFFLMKRATGALRFVVTDSAGLVMTAETSTAYTYAAATWHHVGISWSLKAGTNQTVMQILLDGVQVNTNTSTPYRTTSSGVLVALGNLYVGDNRSSGVTPSTGSPNGANGTIDEVYVYAQEINATQAAADMALTRPVCGALDHFHVVHNGTIANCGGAVASVTVEAHDANHNLFSLAGTTLQLSTSTGHGTWSGLSAINPVVNSGSGNASYTFSNESAVILGLANPYGEAVNINLVSGAITEHSGAASACVAQDYTFGSVCDADLVFSTASCSFAFDAVEPGGAPGAHIYTKLVNTSFTLDVLALNSSGGINNAYTGTANVDLVDASGATCTAVTPSLTTASSLGFVAADVGRKQLVLTYPKAAANVRVRMQTGSAAPTCSADNFAIRPLQFTVTSPDMSNAALTGTPKAAAGSAFTLSANAGVTSGYSGSIPALDVSKVKDHNAATIVVTALTGTFSAGDGIKAQGSSFKYQDVGSLQFAADAVVDSSFAAVDLPNDCAVGSTSNVVSGGRYGCNVGSALSVKTGRWVPSHFSFSGALAAGCSAGGFTYMGQDALGMVLTLKAHAMGAGAASASDPVVSRYTAVSPAYPSLAAVTLAAKNDVTGISAARIVNPAFPAMPNALLWSAGLFQVSDTYALSRASPPDGPFELFKIAASVNDPDGAALIGTASERETATTRVRHGRLRLQNAFGSEKLALAVPVQAQYWNGSYFVNNADDSCTTVAVPAAQTLTGSATPTGVAGLYFYPVTGATGKNQLASTDTVPTLASPLVAGKSSLQFPAPLKRGWLDVILQVPDYLLGNWGNCSGQSGTAGLHDDLPCARVTFGVFGASSPILYRRENY